MPIVGWKMGGKGEYRYRLQAETTDGRRLKGLKTFLTKSGWRISGEIFHKRIKGFFFDKDFGNKESLWLKFLRECEYEIWADTATGKAKRKLCRGKLQIDKK